MKLKAYARNKGVLNSSGCGDEGFAWEYEKIQSMRKWIHLPFSVRHFYLASKIVLNFSILLIYSIFGLRAYTYIGGCQRGSWQYCVYWALATASFILNVSAILFYYPSIFWDIALTPFMSLEIAVMFYIRSAFNNFHIPWIFSIRFIESLALCMILVASHLIVSLILQRSVTFLTSDSLEILVEGVFYSLIFVEFMVSLYVMFYTDSHIQHGGIGYMEIIRINLLPLFPSICVIFVLIMKAMCTRAASILYSQKQMQPEEGKLLFAFLTGVVLPTLLNVIITRYISPSNVQPREATVTPGVLRRRPLH